MTTLDTLGKQAKETTLLLQQATTEEKNAALLKIADVLIERQEEILVENEKDLVNAKDKGISDSVIDRIRLTEERIKQMADALRELTHLADPIGEVLEAFTRPNGLEIEKVAVPIGVVGMIYEARPNVTIDAASLCLKTGNAVILRGSSSAIYSNIALVSVIREALSLTSLPVNSVQLIEDTSRETAEKMFRLNDYLDVLIPRGSKNLIDTVVRKSSVPVLETGAGNCHMYIDHDADEKMAVELVINAKTQRPSVCNAIETVLIHQSWFDVHGKTLIHQLNSNGVLIHGDQKVKNENPAVLLATDEDYATEYLDLEIAMKVVQSTDEAIKHINYYGTKHSEAIISNTDTHVLAFLNDVDAACVYHNASTRFTDGFEFGFGAEIGISTQKLHARGPMGLKALTSTKYLLRGQGQYKK
ncbi:gamma-glutamyl phosphate reductase [Halolactibacillus alkaliphilus]|uniref:Gamma-glutamyl phosphate reductase n=1 Tax=Halolactibacillus alkaliphilus TaxID=442899 RepID=A0A511WZX4_9BACI|nr:glutamate-5-semialdehyde dehydrogenase [Halolactibacillus alkaliphilus]GEN56239.1 gamma-glutamyl phosphate reductase [Halolactibacillus alkaliphilus]GGN66435.1 gamma-glutamyl phosphate reductase [Halolactibacillus alkaliphilus]SFO67615.1 glutamate-5-semialdehyde dehydrogenase [Halolactibacillus alkaliphilus]